MMVKYSALAALLPLISAMPLPIQLNFTIVTSSTEDFSSLSSTSLYAQATSECPDCLDGFPGIPGVHGPDGQYNENSLRYSATNDAYNYSSLSSSSLYAQATSGCLDCLDGFPGVPGVHGPDGQYNENLLQLSKRDSAIDDASSNYNNSNIDDNGDNVMYIYTDDSGNEFIIENADLGNGTSNFGNDTNNLGYNTIDDDTIVLSDDSPLFVSYDPSSNDNSQNIDGVQDKLFGWFENKTKEKDDSYSLPDFGYQSVQVNNKSVLQPLSKIAQTFNETSTGDDNLQNKNFYSPVSTVPIYDKPLNQSAYQQVNITDLDTDIDDDGSSVEKRSLLFNVFHKIAKTNDEDQIEVSLDKSNGLYFLSIRLGFFDHKVSLLLDTESSDMVVRSNDAGSFIPKRNVFNPFYSSTFNKIGPDFKTSLSNIVIEDQISTFKLPPSRNAVDTTGFWGSDNVIFNIHDRTSYEVSNAIIGFARSTDLEYDGVLGLGPKSQEASFIYANKSSYDSFFYMMKNQSLINEEGFTLNLNKSTASFGKLNASDFHTSATLDFESQKNGMYFNLDSFKFGDEELINTSTKAKISTVSKYTKIPKTIFDSKFKGRFGNYSQNYENYMVDCNLAKNSGAEDLKFNFDGTEVTIPFEKLIVQEFPSIMKIDQCVLGVVANDENEDEFVLGRAFLESTPVHYNLETSQITIAGN